MVTHGRIRVNETYFTLTWLSISLKVVVGGQLLDFMLNRFRPQALIQLGKERRARLEDSLRLYKFFGDMEEEEMFVKETEKVLSSKDVGNDLISLTRLQQKHKVSCDRELVECICLLSHVAKTKNDRIRQALLSVQRSDFSA